MHLSTNQIKTIAHYISDCGLTHTEVSADVLDHICTKLEENMGPGKDFELAWKEVQTCFSPKHLAEIQQDTNYFLTIKQTIKMIKGIFISAYAAICLYVLSFGIKGFLVMFLDLNLVELLSRTMKLGGISVFCFVFLPLVFSYGYKRLVNNLREV